VQGTAADGTLYAGEDATFRTPPAPVDAEVNLASLEAGAKVVAVSSNFGAAANDAFLEIELAQPAQVHAVEVWTRSMSNGTAQILAFTLTTDTGDVLGLFELADATEPYRFELEDVFARSLRLDVVESSGGNTGLVGLAVYGTPVEE
jgi:hypothetical protein